MTIDEAQAEIERLHQFILQVSEHLYAAAEVLAIRAEKRTAAGQTQGELFKGSVTNERLP